MNAIDKIHEFEKFGSILGLERMTSLMAELGNPQDKLKCFHVAGTNGKGSVCKYIYEALQAEGFKTGLYTSPFLEVFNERIEFDHAFISDEDLEKYTDTVLEKVKILTGRGEDSPTEFEVITAVAFLYFKEKKADYVVLEVGLGGIGDSTNIIKNPVVSVISSISYDHMDRLGNTLSEIAANKAGIIKKGCPVVTSVKDEEALAVIEEKAKEEGSLFFYTKNLPVNIKEESIDGTLMDVLIQGVNVENLRIGMAGRHQVENAVAALAALAIYEVTTDFKISRKAVLEGFLRAKQIGRFEIMKREPLIVIDGAHNADGAHMLVDTVLRYAPDKKTLIVTGMLKDKDTDEIIEQLTSIASDFIATEPENSRKMEAEELKKKLEAKGARVEAVDDCRDAVKKAIGLKEEYELILFTGSLYFIGAARSILRQS